MKDLWNKFTKYFTSNNRTLIVLSLILITIGAITIYSISPYRYVNIFESYWPFFAISVVLLFACSYLSKKWVVRICFALGIIGILFIFKSRIDPTMIAGAARYIQIGKTSINVYLFNLPAYIVLVSYYLNKQNTWSRLICIIITLFICCAAISAPDLFMAMIYIVLFFTLAVTSATSKKTYIYIIVGISIFMLLTIVSNQHVQLRLHDVFCVDKYTAPWFAQNMITNSQFIGTNPTALNYLSNIPNSISDYMLYSIGAKFGIVTLLMVLLAECGLVLNIRHHAINNKDNFIKCVLIGMIILLLIGILAQLLVPFISLFHWHLPFVSFGGTVLCVFCILIGFVVALTRKSKH